MQAESEGDVNQAESSVHITMDVLGPPTKVRSIVVSVVCKMVNHTVQLIAGRCFPKQKLPLLNTEGLVGNQLEVEMMLENGYGQSSQR